MTVFKGYLLIIRRNINIIIMYIAIFAGVAMMIQKAAQKEMVTENFAAEKLNVAVMNRDGSVLGDTLLAMLERDQNVVELEDDITAIQEALYYRDIEYVLVIPEGAQQSFLDGDTSESVVQSITVPDSTMSFYVDSQVNALMNQIRTYQAGGFSFEEACAESLLLGETEPDITLIDINGNAGVRADYNYFFGYMPYAFLGATIMTISLVIMEFKNRDIQRRMQSCSVPFLKQNIATVAAFLLVGCVIWFCCILLHAIMCRGGVFTDKNSGYYLINSICCMLVALSLGYLTGMLSGGPAALNGMNNVLSLGLCFLGGIFVPIEMLGSTVEKIARFLPTYWYSRINGILGDYSVLGDELRATVYKGYVIQILFAAACFGLTMMVRRRKIQEKN